MTQKLIVALLTNFIIHESGLAIEIFEDIICHLQLFNNLQWVLKSANDTTLKLNVTILVQSLLKSGMKYDLFEKVYKEIEVSKCLD